MYATFMYQLFCGEIYVCRRHFKVLMIALISRSHTFLDLSCFYLRSLLSWTRDFCTQSLHRRFRHPSLLGHLLKWCLALRSKKTPNTLFSGEIAPVETISNCFICHIISIFTVRKRANWKLNRLHKSTYVIMATWKAPIDVLLVRVDEPRAFAKHNISKKQLTVPLGHRQDTFHSSNAVVQLISISDWSLSIRTIFVKSGGTISEIFSCEDTKYH